MLSISLQITNQKIIIVGGGKVALHKAENLTRLQIPVQIISPIVHTKLQDMADDGKVLLIKKEVQWTDLADAFLIIFATTEQTVQQHFVAKAMQDGKIVVNAAHPACGNAHLPAILKRGKLQISVSTSGASPTLAKAIRQELSVHYDERYEDYLDFLAEVRIKVKQQIVEEEKRRMLLKKAAHPRYLTQPDLRASFLQQLTSSAQSARHRH